jgi:hypothetical protein
MAALGLLLVACGTPSVRDLCEELDSECKGIAVSDCIDDGHDLESRAELEGCTDAFEEYLDCIDDELCAWASECTDTRAEVISCVGTSP